MVNNLSIIQSNYQENVKNDKFEKIENTLETIKKEKLQIVSQVLEKEVILETIVNKSDNLKRNVSKIVKEDDIYLIFQSISMMKNFDIKKKKNSKNFFLYTVIAIVIVRRNIILNLDFSFYVNIDDIQKQK